VTHTWVIHGLHQTLGVTKVGFVLLVVWFAGIRHTQRWREPSAYNAGDLFMSPEMVVDTAENCSAQQYIQKAEALDSLAVVVRLRGQSGVAVSARTLSSTMFVNFAPSLVGSDIKEKTRTGAFRRSIDYVHDALPTAAHLHSGGTIGCKPS